MKTALRFTFAAAALLLLATPARAEEVVIKLGTLAPSGSPWHNLIKEMGQKWKEASNGQVSLRIYPGGVVGNEGDMVRKMRVGQLQAAAVTTIGLHDITPEPQAVDAPLVITSYEQLDYVMDKVGPQLEKYLEAKGYVVLAWADVGFVRFFSTSGFKTPQEMQGHKIFAWDGDPASVEAWKKIGLQPVVLSSTDVVPSLQTGMIDTVSAAPLYAFTARLFQKANKMLDLRWSILIGATVVKKESWEQIPADMRPKLLAIAKDYGRRIALEVRKMNDSAIAQMKAQGLQELSPGDMAGWQKVADAANTIVRGKVVPAAIFDEVKKLADEWKATHH